VKEITGSREYLKVVLKMVDENGYKVTMLA
jgi:hypothetical protein